MRAKTELFLYRLLWLAEKPMVPTFRNLEMGFEGWAYRNGLLRQIQRLETQGFLESQIDSRTGKRLHRLTEAGRLAAIGGRDPEDEWNAPWDGKWRLFLFDIPEGQSWRRRKLTRALADAGCGCLQGSVWIAARVSPELESLVEAGEGDCSRLLLLLADSKGPPVDRKMVKAAWDFDRINERYRKAMAVLAEHPTAASAGENSVMEEWTERERAAWKSALAIDPLLPAGLLPRGYLGRRAWQKRLLVMARLPDFATVAETGVEGP